MVRHLVGLGALIVALPACIFAPGPLPGVAAGEACVADLDCDSGLVCGCGVCEELVEPRRPPACDVQPDNRCGDVPSPCYEACGVEVVVGIAECVAGRETCAASGGVLEDDCPPDTCWGEPAPGEICVDGVFQCAFGRSGPTGLCYTFDCEGAPEECVQSCADDDRTTQACLGGGWRCETGFPVRQCGGCVGTPPGCVDGCATLVAVGAATCIEEDWSCAATASGVLFSSCCLDSMSLLAPEDVDVDVLTATCVLGDVVIGSADLTGDLELPALLYAGQLTVVDSLLDAVSLPALRTVDDALELIGNPVLDTFTAPALTAIGGALTATGNPSLDPCALAALRAQVEARDGIGGAVTLPALPDGGCPELDAGVVDGGDVDGGAPDGGDVDGGDVDGGDVDGGATDGGVDDAGGADGGAADAGAVDGGAEDGGLVDGGAADGG